MKTIALDIHSKEELLLDVQHNAISFKSTDLDHRFCLALYENKQEWDIPGDAVLSVWYSGPGGEGSYSEVNGESAFCVSGNTVIITPAPEMISAPGCGFLCLAIHRANGAGKVLWNLVYTVEGVPAADNPQIATYFAAFSGLIRQAQSFISEHLPDKTLTLSGKAADAAAVGDALAEKAPVGFGLGGSATKVTDLNTATETGFYMWSSAGINAPFNVSNGGGSMLVIKRGEMYIAQYAFDNNVYNLMAVRTKKDFTWGAWEWVNPPMEPGVEYRTTQRFNGKPVYTKAIQCGALGHNAQDIIYHNISSVDAIWVSGGSWYRDGSSAYSIPYFGGGTDNLVLVSATDALIYRVHQGAVYNITDMTVVLKYTKTTD